MKKVLICSMVVIALFAFGACGGGGGGETTKLYGTTLGNDTLGESVLVRLSPSTGALLSTIGSVGYYINGLEYDHVSNKLYGSTSTNDPVFPNGLIEIDMKTAAATTIGSGAGMFINCLTVNSAGEMYAWTESADDLITVDTVAGTASTLGDSGVSTGGHGLAFDNSDVLYLVYWGVDIFTIDTASGAATLYTTLVAPADIAHHGDFHPETDMYWGLSPEPWHWEIDSSRDLLVIDVMAAAIDTALPTVDYLHAITFYGD